jgi:hypothetical protein
VAVGARLLESEWAGCAAADEVVGPDEAVAPRFDGWQGRDRAPPTPPRHGPVSPEVLGHLSPALMEHFNLYGTYTFPIEKVRDLASFRPLRLAELAGQATA